MKRLILIALVGLVLLAAGGVVAFKYISRSGSTTIENWIGQQLQLIANSYLNPKLSFDDLDYEFPSTVSVKNMRLVADDPSSAGATVDILGCSSAIITLAEVPAVGKPIVIEKIILQEPLVSVVAVGKNSSDFIGFSNLMRSGPTSQPQEKVKLSDRFQMRLVQINNGQVLYDPRIPGTEPMVLDKINTVLNVEPADAGWYKLSTTLSRAPVFELGVAGQLNLDTFSARDLALKLAASLSPDKLSYLPPQIQQQLKKYEITGELTARIISTELPLMDPLKGDVDVEVKLASANVTLGEYRIPIKSLDLAANMAQGDLTVPTLKVAALQGSAELSGATRLDGNFDTDLKIKVAGMMLQDLLAGRKEGEPHKLAGKLDADVAAKAPMKLVLARVMPDASRASIPAEPLPPQWGNGSIRLTEAHLGRVKLIDGLTDAISRAMNIVRAGNASTDPREKATIVFNFRGDRIDVIDVNYIGEAVGVRGKGMIGLDSSLDLMVNGGPVERVQQMLGDRIGGAIGIVTDRILAYHVTGTVGQPKIQPIVAGVQGGGRGIGQALDRIGEGVGNIFKPKEENK